MWGRQFGKKAMPLKLIEIKGGHLPFLLLMFSLIAKDILMEDFECGKMQTTKTLCPIKLKRQPGKPIPEVLISGWFHFAEEKF